MCGTLKFEKKTAKIGSSVPAVNLRLGSELEAIWSGFVRTEKLAWWKKNGRAETVVIRPSHFDEQGKTFKVTKGAVILGLLLGADVMIGGKLVARAGEIRIITRAAETNTEKEVHHRWPVVLTRNTKSCYLFNEQDIASK